MLVSNSLFGHQTNGKAATRCLGQLQGIALLDRSLGDDVCLRILLVVGILGIGIDGAVVFAAFVEEVELDDTLVTILVALTANEPVVSTFGLAGYGDVVGRLCFKIDALVPVASHVADELEGIVELLVVLRQVGCHLQG